MSTYASILGGSVFEVLNRIIIWAEIEGREGGGKSKHPGNTAKCGAWEGAPWCIGGSYRGQFVGARWAGSR